MGWTMFFIPEVKKTASKVPLILAVIVLTMFLISCSSKKEREPEQGEIKIHLIADKDINPNEYGHPAPLNLFIYNVREVDVFSNADFFEIIEGTSKALQSASSEIYEAILKPGEKRTIFLKPENDVQTLGIVGAYRNLNDSVWLITWTLPKTPRSWWGRIFSDDGIELNVNFKKTAMIIKKMD